MAYGHLDVICAPRRKRDEERFARNLIQYYTVIAILSHLYRRGELSMETWYAAENIIAERNRLSKHSIYRIWGPTMQHSSEEAIAMRRLYMQNKNTDRTEH